MASAQPATAPPGRDDHDDNTAASALRIVDEGVDALLPPADEVVTGPAEPGSTQVTLARLRAYGSILVARGLLVGIILVMLAAVYAQAVKTFFPVVGATVVLAFSAAAVTLGCALPAVLMYCMKVLVVGSLGSRVRFRLPSTPRAAGGAATDPNDLRLIDEASRLWQHEIEQMDQRSSRLSQHVNFYGFFCSLSLSTAALFVLAGKPGQPLGDVAVAVASATVLAFVLDISRMIVRAANRDASARMFAWASKRFLLVLIGTVLLGCLVLIGKSNADVPVGIATWILIGAGMAFLGDRATQAVGERVAGVLGVAAPRSIEAPDLLRIDGMGLDDVARLAEEGVATVHQLAFAATPKLFLSTPFTLQQLCDWQDQALLIARLGPARAAVCREQLMLRGATDAQRLACDHLEGRLSVEEKGDLLRMLGLSSAVQATAAMRRLAQDQVARRLDIYRRAVPDVDPETTGDRTGKESRR